MTFKPLWLLGATLALAFAAACTTTSSSGGAGGAGGTGSSTTSATSSPSSTSTATSGTTSSDATSSSSTGGACHSCAAVTSDPSLDPASLCADNGPPSSLELYDGVAACLCGEGGPCAAACADSACVGGDPMTDADCVSCVLTPGELGCGDQYTACANDT